MDTTAVTTAVQTIDANVWIELLKLAIFSVFVMAIIEVVKGIWESYAGKPLDTKHILVMSFGIALLCTWSFDYGIITRIVQTGLKIREGVAGWIDYFGTASLIYQGAGTMFDKFDSLRKRWQQSNPTKPE